MRTRDPGVKGVDVHSRRTARIALSVWVLVILSATSVPLPPGPVGTGAWMDKVAHLVLYFVLGLLAAWSLDAGRPSGSVRAPGTGAGRWTELGWLVLGLIAIFAGADELHQHWIRGRSPSMADWVADVIGASLGFATGDRWGRAGRTPTRDTSGENGG